MKKTVFVLLLTALAASPAPAQSRERDVFEEALELISRSRFEEAMKIGVDLTLEPGREPAGFTIEGLVHYHSGRFSDARDSFEKARNSLVTRDEFAGRVREYCAMAFTALALEASRNARLNEGLELVDQALARDPGYGPAYNARGYALEMLGRQRDALRAYEAAAERLADPSYAVLRAGFLMDWLHDYKGAVANFETYLSSPGADEKGKAQAHMHLGLIAFDGWRLGKARRHFTEALRADGGLESARTSLARVEEAIGKVRKTARYENRLWWLAAGLMVLYLGLGTAAWFRFRS